MQQIHVYTRHYFNQYHDHVQKLEATFYLDSPIYQYLMDEWEEQRFNALYEYEVLVETDEYNDLAHSDDTGVLQKLFKYMLDDEDCYLSIY